MGIQVVNSAGYIGFSASVIPGPYAGGFAFAASQPGWSEYPNPVDFGYDRTFVVGLSAVPEPGSSILLLGGLGLMTWRIRRNQLIFQENACTPSSNRHEGSPSSNCSRSIGILAVLVTFSVAGSTRPACEPTRCRTSRRYGNFGMAYHLMMNDLDEVKAERLLRSGGQALGLHIRFDRPIRGVG